MVLRNANCKNTLECHTLKDPAPRKKGRQCRPAGQGKVPLSLRVFTSRPVWNIFDDPDFSKGNQWTINRSHESVASQNSSMETHGWPPCGSIEETKISGLSELCLAHLKYLVTICNWMNEEQEQKLLGIRRTVLHRNLLCGKSQQVFLSMQGALG